MNIKQTSISIIIGIISSSICFSFGFFSSVYTYNGWSFFLTYTILTLIFSLPVSLTTIFLEKKYPTITTHTQLTKKLSNTSKLTPLSLLVTGTLLILLSIILFEVSTYILDFFDNVPAIDRLSESPIVYDNNLIMYSILGFIFLIIALLAISAVRGKFNIDKILEILSHTSLYLLVILVLLTVRVHNFHIGVESFFNLSPEISYNFKNMLAMATIYAILSNFISIILYKTIIEVRSNDPCPNIKSTAIKSVIYTIIFSFVLCMVTYALIGKDISSINFSTDAQAINIFSVIKDNNPGQYLVLEVIYITLNLITLLVGINYLVKISKNSTFRLVSLIIPFVMAIALVNSGIFFLDFSDLFILHIVIFYIFLFDIFVVGWLYDAQRLSYEMMKEANLKVSAFFNIFLRIVIPAICIYILLGYIFNNLNLLAQIAVTIILLVIYIAKGSYFKKRFNQRRF
ncbi:hypothetical protein [Francisella frigiditurris]|uniref:Putative membrane protein n=1 Tax=Francisella frigiditurris TaxID=1542390 RepID=A0A1J0KS99_9GAMM|nr:hypothetical protein [Francisella frigiditurris]APC96653.1 putative membrane protein [Francisella frigiditurris]